MTSLCDSASPEQPTMKEIEQGLNAAVFGQEHAIRNIMPWIKRNRFGIPRDGRPAAVFLFLGPTGTGKTQLAKELARYVYGDKNRLLYIEMGQFQTAESMNLLVGATPGYVGYGEGRLTNGLREMPEGVLLLDDIHLAGVAAMETIHRLVREGRVTDESDGAVIDASKCMLVMATNICADWLREHLAANPNALDDKEALARQYFAVTMKEWRKAGIAPNLLADADQYVVLFPWSFSATRQAIDIVLDRELPKFHFKQVDVQVPDAVRDALARLAMRQDDSLMAVERSIAEHILTPAITLFVQRNPDADYTQLVLLAALDGSTPAVERLVQKYSDADYTHMSLHAALDGSGAIRLFPEQCSIQLGPEQCSIQPTSYAEILHRRFSFRRFGDVYLTSDRLLGKGVDSVVLKGTLLSQPDGGYEVRPVAIKIQGPLNKPREVDAFIRGSLVLQSLLNSAPSNVRQRLAAVLAIGTTDDWSGAPARDWPDRYGWVASELVRGQLLAEFSRMPIRNALDTIIQLCEVMGFAHGMPDPVIHADLHPGNLLIEPNGGIVLIDFGSVDTICRYLIISADNEFVAPELQRMCRAVPGGVPSPGFDSELSPTMDVFSIGALLYRLISGSSVAGKTSFPMKTLENVLPARIVERLEACIRKAIAKDPAERFHDARTLGEELDAIRGMLT